MCSGLSGSTIPPGRPVFSQLLACLPHHAFTRPTDGRTAPNAHAGYHEFDLKLSSRLAFLEDTLNDIIRKWLVIFTCLTIGIISLLIDFITPSRLTSTFDFTMIRSSPSARPRFKGRQTEPNHRADCLWAWSELFYRTNPPQKHQPQAAFSDPDETVQVFRNTGGLRADSPPMTDSLLVGWLGENHSCLAL